jgi:asparagine synthase (glutamine-hydrolysing)
MANGLEVRVPFLDKKFLELSMSIEPDERLPTNDRIEKHVLRKAFEDPVSVS